MNPIVSVVACKEYDLDAVRQAVKACLEPLGGLARFVKPGMRVLLKPNLLAAAEEEQAVTTHPIVVRAVAELVQAAGGRVLIGDSPSGPLSDNAEVLRKSGMLAAAEACGATIVPFESVVWKQHQGVGLFHRPPGAGSRLTDQPAQDQNARLDPVYRGGQKPVRRDCG